MYRKTHLKDFEFLIQHLVCSSGWSQTHYVAEVDPQLLILLFSPTKGWDYSCVPPCSVLGSVEDQIQSFRHDGQNSTIKWFKKLNGVTRETVPFPRILVVLMEDRYSVRGTNIRQFTAVHYSMSRGSYILFWFPQAPTFLCLQTQK